MLKTFLNRFSKGIDKISVFTKSETDYQAILMDYDDDWIRLRVDFEEDGVKLGTTDILVKMSEIERIGECKPNES